MLWENLEMDSEHAAKIELLTYATTSLLVVLGVGILVGVKLGQARLDYQPSY